MRTAVVATGLGPHRQIVRIGPHTLVADEPVESGGDDAGPEPHEWLLASLATCTSITVKMYATRKAWPLESVEVSVSGDHVDGTFVMKHHVKLRGPLTDEQRARLFEVADRCPVHKVLYGPIRIDTDLVDGG
jgi:putative redox protein